jgi:type IV pilus assembly protein PilE
MLKRNKMLLGKQSGFTLIEVLITVAIIGILSAVAYPSYTDYVTQSNRTEAKRELARVANKMEQYYVDHRTYTNDMTLLGLGADPYITETGRYSIDTPASVSAGELAQGRFTLTATALATQASADPDCTTLSIDHTGQKTAESTHCWEG